MQEVLGTVLSLICKFFPIVTVILGSVTLILTGLVGIFMQISGPQPEGFLQQVVDFIAKYSRK